jgi:hypothetical protein
MNNIGVEIGKSPLTLDYEIRFSAHIGEKYIQYVDVLGDINQRRRAELRVMYKQSYEQFKSQLESVKEKELSKLKEEE